MNIHIKKFAYKNECAKDLAESLCNDIQSDLKIQNECSIAMSGGSTPIPLWNNMQKIDLPYDKIKFTLVDERWLPATDVNSNQFQMLKHWNKLPLSSFVPLYGNEETALLGQSACEKRLQGLKWPLTAVILGMGTDGHTCSWFSDAKEFSQLLDLNQEKICLPMQSVSSNWPRITMTLQAVLKSKKIYLHINGMNKILILEKILSDPEQSPLPIANILKEKNIPIYIYTSKED
ncbi:MAG: 6-phosphogluconolactonase [Pseudobdellovibrionaceae bacterium]